MSWSAIRTLRNIRLRQVAESSRVRRLKMPGRQRSIVPNRRRRAAPYLMIGQTGAKRDITVVLLPTDAAGTWVAYTAWDTKASDE
jgi:hypothetical protein